QATCRKCVAAGGERVNAGLAGMLREHRRDRSARRVASVFSKAEVVVMPSRVGSAHPAINSTQAATRHLPVRVRWRVRVIKTFRSAPGLKLGLLWRGWACRNFNSYSAGKYARTHLGLVRHCAPAGCDGSTALPA